MEPKLYVRKLSEHERVMNREQEQSNGEKQLQDH